ncbi:MAG: outer membrane beta-barrel protein [Oligoflexia bacterium]|nr:outer membrane beta-barrel protein [Oligoflexia bacterium]
MNRLIVVFTTLFILTLFYKTAQAEEGHHALGFQAGHVGLSGDVGSRYGNALGWGVFADYAASDWLDFELGYLNSKHTNNSLSMTQNALSASILYNVDQFDLFIPYLRGGAEFVSANEDIVNPSNLVPSGYSTTAFGLDVGFGGKFLIGTNFMAGADFTYHSMFDSNVSLPNGTNAKAIQSYLTVMLRLGFVFGAEKKEGKTF